MSDSLRIRIHGGGSVRVPPLATFLSTYVLLEQEDWFEKEIGFVRQVVREGMRALDVGANYGCYSLALARAVGSTGRVWLFEPTAATHALLSATLADNELEWVTPFRLALSDRTGTDLLAVGSNSELNSLGHNGPAPGSERVGLTTLDRARRADGIEDVDFVKLDAEGEELRILSGGASFFRDEDPLVMFEVKHGTAVNAELPGEFNRLGYDLYRLIGPDRVLVPAPPLTQLDPYELNLFACKPSRAARLQQDGFLTSRVTTGIPARADCGMALMSCSVGPAAIAAHTSPRDPEYAQALDRYAAWRDAARSWAERVGALQGALHGLASLCQTRPSLPRLTTLGRIAHEAGARSIAVETLQRILRALGERAHALDEPFWPAWPRFDGLQPGSDPGAWLTASAAEALVCLRAYSGYFSGPTALPLLDWLHGSGYASAALERRRELQAIFAQRQSAVGDIPLLRHAAPDHLNPELWAAGTRFIG